MCNLYSQTRAQEAMRQLFQHRGWTDRTGNLEPGDIYPDQLAPIIRNAADGGLELVKAASSLPPGKAAGVVVGGLCDELRWRMAYWDLAHFPEPDPGVLVLIVPEEL